MKNQQQRTVHMNERCEHELRRLPKEDFDAACAYFEEYFDEAGEKNEIQAMEDLGSPRQAARELIVSLAVKNSRGAVENRCQKRLFLRLGGGFWQCLRRPLPCPWLFAAVLVVASLGLALCPGAAFRGAFAGRQRCFAEFFRLFREDLSFSVTGGRAFQHRNGAYVSGRGCGCCPGGLRSEPEGAERSYRSFGKMVKKICKGR